MSAERIPLSPGYYAEPGTTADSLFSVYRINASDERPVDLVGRLSRDAVEAWRRSEEQFSGLTKTIVKSRIG